MTEWFSQLKKGTKTAKKTAITVAKIFSTDWMPNFGIPPTLLTGNGTHFTSRGFSGDTSQIAGDAVSMYKISPPDKRLGGKIQEHDGIKTQVLRCHRRRRLGHVHHTSHVCSQEASPMLHEAYHFNLCFSSAPSGPATPISILLPPDVEDVDC